MDDVGCQFGNKITPPCPHIPIEIGGGSSSFPTPWPPQRIRSEGAGAKLEKKTKGRGEASEPKRCTSTRVTPSSTKVERRMGPTALNPTRSTASQRRHLVWDSAVSVLVRRVCSRTPHPQTEASPPQHVSCFWQLEASAATQFLQCRVAFQTLFSRQSYFQNASPGSAEDPRIR